MTEIETGATPEPHVYRVGELMTGVRQLLEDRVGRVWVAGEVSNFFEARSGHRYFTLKDEGGQVRAALFRGAARNLPFEIEEGSEVRVYAELTVYEPRGDLQLIVRQIEPVGTGAAQRALEALRRRLLAEGLFDDGRKRPLPEFPRAVGVVTSQRGAALRDVIEVSRNRFPGVWLRVFHTPVQGAGSVEGIAAALGGVSEVPGIDVVLLVRGGGSFEDLASFNSETVVRAVAQCPIPVVTGVGHEIDFTLVDAASDARASTPSAAAALVVPERMALRQRIEAQWQRLESALDLRIAQAQSAWALRHDALTMRAPSAQLAEKGLRLEAAARSLARAASEVQRRTHSRFAECAGRLDALSPLSVLDRGYAVVRKDSDGDIVRSASQVAPGERLAIRVAQAQIVATAERVETTD